LTKQLGSVLSEIHANPNVRSTEPAPAATSSLDALALARDAAALIRSHATKLSLLIINEPFTPSAVSTVIRELVSGPIPGIASAVQACDPFLHTALFRKELAWRSKRVLLELGALVSRVPQDGKALSGANRDAFHPDAKGSMAATGLLWSACDDVSSLIGMGVGGLFVRKVEEWRDTLKDVMDELKEWGEEEPESDSDDDDHDGDDDDEAASVDGPANENQTGGNGSDATRSAQDIIDELMNSNNAIPKNDPDGIRPRLESSIRRIRLVILLYQAIVKRRLKKLPALPGSQPTNIAQRLDEAARVLCRLPDEFGDLAAAFYEMEPAPIDAAMDQCFFFAFAAGELLIDDWDGQRDEFSQWTTTFKVEIKKS
jgi:hypothetical protein